MPNMADVLPHVAAAPPATAEFAPYTWHLLPCPSKHPARTKFATVETHMLGGLCAVEKLALSLAIRTDTTLPWNLPSKVSGNWIDNSELAQFKKRSWLAPMSGEKASLCNCGHPTYSVPLTSRLHLSHSFRSAVPSRGVAWWSLSPTC